MKNLKNSFLPLAVGGLFAGFANGLLGAGGGIITVYLLSSLLKDRGSSRDIFANSLCVLFPVSLVSCLVYFSRGGIEVPSLGLFLLPAVVGGVVGGFALSRINTAFLKKIFSLLVVISGIILALK